MQKNTFFFIFFLIFNIKNAFILNLSEYHHALVTSWYWRFGIQQNTLPNQIVE